MVTIFVPPAVLDEVELIFDGPVATHEPQQIGGGYPVRVETAHKIADVPRDFLAGGSAKLAIDP